MPGGHAVAYALRPCHYPAGCLGPFQLPWMVPCLSPLPISFPRASSYGLLERHFLTRSPRSARPCGATFGSLSDAFLRIRIPAKQCRPVGIPPLEGFSAPPPPEAWFAVYSVPSRALGVVVKLQPTALRHLPTCHLRTFYQLLRSLTKLSSSISHLRRVKPVFPLFYPVSLSLPSH